MCRDQEGCEVTGGGRGHPSTKKRDSPAAAAAAVDHRQAPAAGRTRKRGQRQRQRCTRTRQGRASCGRSVACASASRLSAGESGKAAAMERTDYEF